MEQQRPSKFVPGLQSEPFYDLLQPSSSVQSSPVQFSSVQSGSNLSSGSTSTGGGFPDLKVSNEPSFDFQPLRPLKGKSNGEDLRNRVWQEESSTDSGNGKSMAPSNMHLGVSLDSQEGHGKNQSPLRNISRDPPGGRSVTPDVSWHPENSGSYGQQYNEPSGPKYDELKTETVDHATVNAVEQTMKKYADNLLRVLEDMTGRLQHLESTTSRLENVVTDIQVAVGNSHGDMSGRLRSLDNIIREVQRGVQNLRDKQEIAETQAELAKMQISSVPPPPPHPTTAPDTTTPHTLPPLPLPPAPASQAPSAPPQTEPSLPSSAPSAPVLTSVPMESPPPPYLPALPPPPLALPPPPNQHQSQGPPMQQQHSIPPPQMQQQNVPQTTSVPHGMQISSYGQPVVNPTPHYPQETPHYPQEPPHYPQEPPHYSQEPPHYMPHNQGLPPPSLPPPTPNPTPSQPQFSNAPQNNPPQSQMPYPSQAPQTEGPQPFMGGYGGPQRGAPPSLPLSQQGQPGQQPSQGGGGGGGGQFQSPPQTMYDSYNFPGRGSYPPPPPPQSHPTPSMYESPPLPPSYGNPPSYRVAQPVPSVPSSGGGGGGGGGGGYPRLQLAQPVSHSNTPPPPPTSSSSGPPNSGGGPLNASRVPIDKVIEDVAAMGFTKDQVRAVVRKLTENGQSVDLNVVLDKLMNPEPGQKGWFNR